MKKYLAEFVGTLVLVLFGCGTAVVLGCQAGTVNAAYLGTALAFGLCIVAMAYSIGNVSGCHINPAVSLGVLLTGGMSFGDFIGYVIASSRAPRPARPCSAICAAGTAASAPTRCSTATW